MHKSTNTLPELQEAFFHQEPDRGSALDSTSIDTPESKEDDTGPIPVIPNINKDNQLSTITKGEKEEE